MFALLLLYFLRFSAGTLISHHRDSGACFKQFIPAHTGFPNARCRFPLGGNPAIKGSFIRNVYTCCRRKQAHGWGYSSLCTSCSAIRGFLYPWSEWSICSKTCSSGEQHRFRICSNGVCPGVKGRRIMETRKCLWSACCPVDGKWDTWSSWSLCSATCGSGLQHRTRSCSSPAPSCGGKACSSYPRQLRRCNVGFCANWSSWQTMSLCGVTCGEGIQHRVRKCHNPLGDECKGENESYFPCVVGSCAVNGGWCSWESWSSCTSSCRNVMGTRKRARACSCPAPKDGGRDCEGDDGDVERCSTNAECSVNGEWSRWSSWGECSAKKCSFVSGIQKRFRECNKPLPRNNGLPCFGFAIDNRGCLFMDSCKVNAVYGKWSQWTPCSATCGLCGVKSRTRRCFSPFDSKKLFRTINVIGNPVLDCDVSATSSVARCHFGRCPDGSFPCGHEPIKILDTTSHLTTEIPSSTILFTPSNDPTTSLTTAPHDNSNYSEITTDQKRKYTSTLLNKVTGVKQVISQVLRSTSTASVQHTTAEDKSNSYDKLFSTEMLARYSTTFGTTLYVSNGETSVPIKSGSQNTKQKQEGIPASTKSYLRFAESEQHMPQKIKGLHTDITDSPVKFRLSTEPRGTITLSTANLQNFKQPESTIADDLPIKILQQNWPEASADANYDVENTYSNNFNEQMIQKGKNPSLNEDFSIINNFEDDQVFESPPEMFRKETFSGDSAFIDREIAEDKLLKGHREEINPMIKSTDPSPSQSYKHLSGHRDPLDPTNGMDKHILPDKINLILGKTEFETDDPLIDEDLSNLIVAVNGYESQDVAHERAELENKWEAELTEKVDIKRDVNGKYDPDEDRVLKYFLLGNNDEELRNENNKAITDQPKSTEEDSSESNHAKDEDHEALLHFFHINNHVLSKENYENVKQGNISLEQNVNASTVNINRNENVAQTKKSRNHTGQFTIEGEGYEKNTTGSTANSEEEYQYNYHKKYNDSVSLHKKQYMYSKEKELHEQHEQLLQFFGLNKSEISGAKETVLKIASDKEPLSLNGDSIPTSEDSITYEEDYPDYDIPVAGEEINMEYDGYYEEDNNYYNYNNYKNQEEYNDNDEDIQTEDTDSIVPNSDYTVVDNAVLKLVFSDDEDFIPNSGLSFSGESERTANRNKNPGDKKDKKRDRKLSKLFNNLREITKKRKGRRKNKEDNNNYENNEEIVTFTEESTACEEMGNFPPNAVMNASECCTLMGSGMNETNGTEKGQQLETCMMNFYDSSPLTDVTAKAVGQCRYKVNTRFLTTICCAKTSCTLWNHGGLRAQCYNCKRLCPPCTQMLLNG